MKKNILTVCSILLVLLLQVTIASSQEPGEYTDMAPGVYSDNYYPNVTGNINIVYGQKKMNTEDWKPTDSLESK